MNIVKLSKQDLIIAIEIKPINPRVKWLFSIVFCLLVSVGCLLLYRLSVHFSNLRLLLFNPRVMMGIITYLFVLFMLMRHFIWFNWGREVVLIQSNEILYYRDFILFAEGKLKKSFQKIAVIYRKDTSKQLSDNVQLVDDILLENKTIIVGFELDENDIVSTHLPVHLAEVQQLSNWLQ